MNHLSDVIMPLNKEEARSYKLFTERLHFEKSDRKVLQLFDFIRSGAYQEKDEALVVKLFGTANFNAYYRLKNRLVNDVERSLVNHHYEIDEKVKVLNQIKLAKIFELKSLYVQAINYLLVAEKLALAADYFDLLNTIYDEILTICKRYNELDPEPFIRKQAENLKKYQLIQQSNTLLATLNYQLKQTNFSGKDKQVQGVIQRLLKKLNAQQEVYKLPWLQLQIHECVRNGLLQKKDFASLESYLLTSWEKFNKEKFFHKSNQNEKIVLLIWIINASYKNKHIHQRVAFINQLEQALNEHGKDYYNRYVWAYVQSRMLYFISEGALIKAIALLNDFKAASVYKELTHYHLNITFNLSSLYFYTQQLNLANKELTPLFSKAIYSQLGIEWKLSLHLLDLILQTEAKEYNYIKREFSKSLALPQFEKEREFLQLIATMNKQLSWTKNKKVVESAQLFISTYKNIEVGSNESVSYVIWLQSVLAKKSFFSLLQSELRSEK
jgi:hypothetical protein